MEDYLLILTKKEINAAVERCAEVINHRFRGEDVVVVPILKGAVYFAVDLTRKLMDHSCYFIEASSYRNEQKQSEEIEILSVINPDKFKGKKVILLDELYDNGRTINMVKSKIMEKGSVAEEDIFTCTLFLKNKVTGYPKVDLYGMSVPDVWLVGYGLDDQQKHRNLEDLYACPKALGIPKSVDDAIFTDIDKYMEMREHHRK